MKSTEEIIGLATRSSLVKNPVVSFLAEGFGNENYLLEENGEKFVLRLKKSTESQFSDSLERENSFLRYFEYCGLDFCPRALFYDADDNCLIENFIEGELVSQRDFSNEQIDQFARQIHELFCLSVPSFKSFCGENDLKVFDYVSPIEDLELYGFNRFEEARKAGLPKEVVVWVESALEQNLKYLKSIDTAEDNLGFSWGDIQSELIIDSAGKMNFYDFEFAAVSSSFGLSYIKINGSFSTDQLDFLIERCADYFKCSKELLVFDMKADEKIKRTKDVVWAAMMWANTGDKKFEDLMYKRIELVNDLR